jgi:hypothetical protein
MAKVIDFPGGTNTGSIEVETDGMPVKTCLDLAAERSLDEVFIIGRQTDGALWLSTNNSSVGNMLFLMELAKTVLMEKCFEN